MRRFLVLLVLASLARCGDSTAPSPVTVTVAAVPQSILPGRSIAVTITVVPTGNATVDYVKITTRGLLVSSESLDVNLSGTFTATRSYTVPQSAGTGTVTVQATASAGGALGNGQTVVGVADDTPPTILLLTVSPSDTAQLGDSLTVTYSVSDNGGLRYTILRMSGAVTRKDSISEQYVLSAQHTVRLRVPSTGSAGPVNITLQVVDVGGNTVNSAASPVVVVDTRPPLTVGSIVNTRGGSGFAPGDTVGLTLTARDNARLQWAGFRFSAPANVHDSFPSTDSTFSLLIKYAVPAAWTGTSTVSIFAVDGAGNRREMMLGTITVANRSRAAPWNAPLSGSVRDMAFDLKRNVLYLSIPDSNRVAVLQLGSKTFDAPFTISGNPRGLDLTLGGDSLLVTQRRTQNITVLNLVTGQRDTVRVNNDNFLNRGPENVRVMGNNKALVTITFDGSGYGGSLVELDLRTRTYASRLTVTEFVPLCRSGDRSTALILIDDSCCPIEGVVYDALSGSFPTDRGTVSRFFNYGSTDYHGSQFLVTGTMFTRTLDLIGSIAPGGSTGPSVLAPDGITAYFATSTGVARVRVNDGVVIDNITLGAQPYLLSIAPDGLTIFAAVADAIHVIDQW